MDGVPYKYMQYQQSDRPTSVVAPSAASKNVVPVRATRGQQKFYGLVSAPVSSALRLGQIDKSNALVSSGNVQVPALPHNPGWLDDLLKELSTASPGKQVAIGGVSGWASGYLIGRVGKIAAVALGGSIILLQIAHYQGIIQVNWTNIERSLQSTRQHFNDQMFDNLPGLLESVRELARRHFFLAGSFFAGFFVGLVI